MRTKEAAALVPYKRMRKQLIQIDPNYRPLFSGDNDYVGADEDEQRFENYVEKLINADVGGSWTDFGFSFGEPLANIVTASCVACSQEDPITEDVRARRASCEALTRRLAR